MKMNDIDKDNYQAVTTVCDNITKQKPSKVIVHTGDRHMHCFDTHTSCVLLRFIHLRSRTHKRPHICVKHSVEHAIAYDREKERYIANDIVRKICNFRTLRSR